MTCDQCRHWALKGSPLREHYFGHCTQDKSQFAQARTLSGSAPCRINQFVQADEKIIQLRKASR